MNRPAIQAGDVFGSRNPDGLGPIINFAQRIWAKDGSSQYGHTGIIKDSAGTTLEAVKTIRNQNLFKNYEGQQIVIARYTGNQIMPAVVCIAELEKQYLGNIYPGWRLLLHIIPPLARWVSYHGKFLVCSELTAKYLYLLSARHGRYTGTNPDQLVDEWRMWRDFEIVYEGVI